MKCKKNCVKKVKGQAPLEASEQRLQDNADDIRVNEKCFK